MEKTTLAMWPGSVNATTYKYHFNELSMYNFLKKKIMKHWYFITFVDLTCLRDESSWRSSCSRSLVFNGPKSSPRRFLQHGTSANGKSFFNIMKIQWWWLIYWLQENFLKPLLTIFFKKNGEKPGYKLLI